jgi:hypothetical protein
MQRIGQKGMSNVKIISVTLVFLGIIALISGGIDYTGQQTVLEVGSFKATATGPKTIPVSSVIGALSLIGGIGLLWVERRPRLVQ